MLTTKGEGRGSPECQGYCIYLLSELVNKWGMWVKNPQRCLWMPPKAKKNSILREENMWPIIIVSFFCDFPPIDLGPLYVVGYELELLKDNTIQYEIQFCMQQMYKSNFSM